MTDAECTAAPDAVPVPDDVEAIDGDAGPATDGADPELMAVGDIAADYVEALLDICDLDGDLDIEESHGRATVTVSAGKGANLALLSDAETVSALQELTRLAVQTRTGAFARLTLDIGGSRDQRARQLAALVDDALARLDAGEDAVPLEPMSSYERKLIHDLAAERGLGSHSEGEGQSRHPVLVRA